MQRAAQWRDSGTTCSRRGQRGAGENVLYSSGIHWRQRDRETERERQRQRVTRTDIHHVSARYKNATCCPSPGPRQPVQVFGREFRLLADEEHIHSAEVKVVVEGQRSKALVGGVLAGIQLPAERSVVSVTSYKPCVEEVHSSGLTMTVLPLY